MLSKLMNISKPMLDFFSKILLSLGIFKFGKVSQANKTNKKALKATTKITASKNKAKRKIKKMSDEKLAKEVFRD